MKRRKPEHHESEPKPIDREEVDERLQRVVERPDGFHWIDAMGRQEFGPYDTVEAALADMDQPAGAGVEEAGWAEGAGQALGIDAVSERDDVDDPDAH